MAKYRKKTLTEFVLYEKGMEDGFKCEDSCGYENLIECSICDLSSTYRKPYIQTLEGKMFISPGDYIGIGIKGERYPIKPDILAATYEKVE